MKSEKTNKIYKIVMLVILTAIITFILTSVLMYNVIGKQNVKNINSTSSIERTFENFRKFIENKYIGTID